MMIKAESRRRSKKIIIKHLKWALKLIWEMHCLCAWIRECSNRYLCVRTCNGHVLWVIQTVVSQCLLFDFICVAFKWYIHFNCRDKELRREREWAKSHNTKISIGMSTWESRFGLSLSMEKYCESAQIYIKSMWRRWPCARRVIVRMYRCAKHVIAVAVAISCLKAIIMALRFRSGAQHDAKWISTLIQTQQMGLGRRERWKRKYSRPT